MFGIALIPGIGWPVVISSTMCAKDVGYGASVAPPPPPPPSEGACGGSGGGGDELPASGSIGWVVMVESSRWD